jgi:hypothetical protein
MWLVSEKIRREKVGSVPTLLLVASREQIRPVENVILVVATCLQTCRNVHVFKCVSIKATV